MIKNEMLKSALPSIIKTVVKIFNVLLKTDQFPDSWREGIIIPIHKQGNSADPNNYRGITLNSCLGKLFSHVINEREFQIFRGQVFYWQGTSWIS